jgi:hypothetical protein
VPIASVHADLPCLPAGPHTARPAHRPAQGQGSTIRSPGTTVSDPV